MLPAEVLPAEDLGDIERIRLDDWRRLRALMFTMLQKASSKGHTFLEWTDLSEKVNKWHTINDKGGNVFNFDLTTWEQYKTEFEPKIVEDRADGIMSIYLKKLREAERSLSKAFRSLIDDDGIASAGINWRDIINNDKSLKMEEQTKEQIDALEKLYTSRLSVLAGSAGTGKTTVIRSFIKGIKEKEPRHDFLLLAPTGKASLILKNRINDPSVPVMTIHSFLMRNDWINKNNFTLKNKGNTIQKSTVIVDESSMIDTLLFCTMIKAIDVDNIERFIFVGDYNQLPPIGPGKVYMT
jgi:ATP-dependent exoDNAse (exonuclease V) alpha subunit